MSEDAIQQDALPQKNARGDAMEDLFTKREAELNDELGIKPEDIVDDEPIDEEPIEDEEVDEVIDEEVEPEDPVYKVKIDGEEIEKPLSEILKGYQKDQAASKRLEQAAQERRRLEEERTEFERQLKEYQTKTSDKPVSQPSNDDDDMAKKLYEKLTYGGEEEGVNALKELLSGRNQAIPQEQIVAEAANKAILQMQYSNAERQFLKDNPDIASDKTLYSLTMQVLGETAKESQTYDEAFEKAGVAVKSWLGKFSPKPEDVSEKESRKKSMPKEPVKTGAKAESFPAPKEETASEIIANMRKSRGLPV